ncbi:MAG: hypothetical protein HKN21_13485, partial [Candidatus Eisenbacteria bacterium]|nr:hypothetical protein [Candidatus Eisenbacteria bacterium]
MQFPVAVVRSGPLPLLRSVFPFRSLGVFCLGALAWILCASSLEAAPEIDPALELLLKKDPAVLASSAHQVLPQSYLPAITREDTNVLVDLFLELDPASAWTPPTAKTVARFGDILAVRLPLADLPDVLKVPDLERVRLSRPLRPQLDRSGSVVGIGSAWSIGQED